MRFCYIAENSLEQVKIWLKLFDPVQKPGKQIIYLWSSIEAIEALLLIVHGVPIVYHHPSTFFRKKTIWHKKKWEKRATSRTKTFLNLEFDPKSTLKSHQAERPFS